MARAVALAPEPFATPLARASALRCRRSCLAVTCHSACRWPLAGVAQRHVEARCCNHSRQHCVHYENDSATTKQQFGKHDSEARRCARRGARRGVRSFFIVSANTTHDTIQMRRRGRAARSRRDGPARAAHSRRSSRRLSRSRSCRSHIFS